MNVVYTFDDGYSMITSVSLYSLFQTNAEVEKLNVFIVDCGISSENKKMLNRLANSFDRTLKFVQAIDLKKKIQIKLETSYWSDVCYIRLFFAEMFPELDKVMHVDCDTLIRDNLENVYNTELAGAVCAACYDCSPCPKYSIGFTEKDHYFSNGLILFDLKKIREEQLEKAFVDYIEKKGGRLPHLDQDVINVVLKDRIKLLPLRYNVMVTTSLFGERCSRLFEVEGEYYTREELRRESQNPAVVHFVGFRFANRPWTQPCYHPYNDEWIAVFNKTEAGKNNSSLYGKKFSRFRRLACWIWNIGYRIPAIREFEFWCEELDTKKYCRKRRSV